MPILERIYLPYLGCLISLLDLFLSCIVGGFDSRAALLEEVNTLAVIRVDIFVNEQDHLFGVLVSVDQRACDLFLRLGP